LLGSPVGSTAICRSIDLLQIALLAVSHQLSATING
jgi:hypothetical protein